MSCLPFNCLTFVEDYVIFRKLTSSVCHLDDLNGRINKRLCLSADFAQQIPTGLAAVLYTVMVGLIVSSPSQI